MAEISMHDLAIALAKGDAALWLGPDWNPAAHEPDRQVLGQQPWLGVWSDARDEALARWLNDEGGSKPRLLIEVPDRIEDALGEQYSIAEVCPYFYLRGRGAADPLRAPARRMARDAKISRLSRLRQAALVLTGYRSATDLAHALEEIETLAPELRIVIVAGVDDSFASALQQALPPDLKSLNFKLRVTDLQIGDLLRQATARRPTPAAGPTVRIGNVSVPLAPFALREFPIDGDFTILTESDIREPDESEDLRELFGGLISGRSFPWRAFSHQLDWHRSLDHVHSVRELITRVVGGDVDVIAVDVPAEAGSGLTTMLRRIAFWAARRGAPSLLFKGNGQLNYDRLRSFLTDLYQHESLDGTSQRMPAVVLFDAQTTAADSMGVLNDLPTRLARDGRRAIIVRGVPIGRSAGPFAATSVRASRPKRSSRTAYVELDRLNAGLSATEQNDLATWVTKSYERISSDLPPAAIGLIRRWDDRATNVPLLVCLYFILRDQFTEVRDLGSLLVKRAKSQIAAPSTTEGPTDPERKLTREEILKALRGFGQRAETAEAPAATEVGAVLLALSAAGTLNARLPRALLGDVAELDSDRVLVVLTALDKADLVDLVSAMGEYEDRLAPVAFYGDDDTVTLRHPAYGRLILEWLASARGTADFGSLGRESGNQMMDLVNIANRRHSCGDVVRLPDYPIELFEPILRHLRPRAEHVRFAEDFAGAYLRFQKNKDRPGCPGLAGWQQTHLELLIEAFGWLDEQVVQQSASLLHSRAITTYKSCRDHLAIEMQRPRYRRAAADLQLAVSRAREQGGEHPGNLITSLGLLYLGWAEHERAAGHLDAWRTLDAQVEDTLRQARRERADNPFAAFGLARYLVERVRRHIQEPEIHAESQERSSEIGRDLAEALELLAGEPESNFADEWRELQRCAIELLSGTEIEQVISELKKAKKDLGYALEALRILDGLIPAGPTTDSDECDAIRQAAAALHAAEQQGVPGEALGNLLRYALFSADPDRLANPRYTDRYSRIATLEGTLYLEQPVWLFDYAMLSFQVGKHEQAAEAFANLRRGKRFFEVPRERSTMLTEGPDTHKPRSVFARIVSADDGAGKGWCRVEHPIRLRDPVPFSIRSFESRGKHTKVGATATVYIALNPAGPYAEPEPR